MYVVELLFKWFIIPAFSAYAILCVLLYWQQERIIFLPQKLPADFTFDEIEQAHEEIFISLRDGETMHALWYPSEGNAGRASMPDGGVEGDGRSDKLILYLHGNAGSLAGWGTIAGNYLGFGYDLLIPDYRGFGKSTGRIRSEEQFLDDIREVWGWVVGHYDPKNVIVIGYSIGGMPASMLGAENPVQAVVLKSTFYSARKLRRTYYPMFPGFLLRYELDTASYLRQIASPVYVLHGDADEVTPVDHAYALAEHLKTDDELLILPYQTHNGMNHNVLYHRFLERLLTGFTD